MSTSDKNGSAFGLAVSLLDGKLGLSIGSIADSGKESGVILDVKPTIRDDEIDLAIKQQLSNFIPTTTGVNNSPTLIKREIQTAVSIKPDELIMLGGMNQTKQTGSRRGLSFLPSWTHTKTDDSDQTELLLVIHAQRL